MPALPPHMQCHNAWNNALSQHGGGAQRGKGPASISEAPSGDASRSAERSWTVVSLTSRRRPSEKLEEHGGVRSCKTTVRRSESIWLVICVFLLVVCASRQQETILASSLRISQQAPSGPSCAQLAKNQFTEQILHPLTLCQIAQN